jgi:hypothetical protein
MDAARLIGSIVLRADKRPSRTWSRTVWHCARGPVEHRWFVPLYILNTEAPARAALSGTRAKAQLSQAQVNLERTRIRSSVGGYMTNLLAQLGDYMNVGVNTISIVDANSFWVDGRGARRRPARRGRTCGSNPDRSPATGSATASREPNANKRSRTRRKSLNFQGSSGFGPRSGRGGRRFKSCHSDHTSPSLATASRIRQN